jgi:hypothetical protein
MAPALMFDEDDEDLPSDTVTVDPDGYTIEVTGREDAAAPVVSKVPNRVS